MAIKLLRICDRCEKEHEVHPSNYYLHIGPMGYQQTTILVDFVCSDCILEEARIESGKSEYNVNI